MAPADRTSGGHPRGGPAELPPGDAANEASDSDATGEASAGSTAEPAAVEDATRKAGRVDVVAEAIDRLTAEIHRLNERAEHREAIIDSLHAELETLRRGDRRTLLRPVLTAAARLHGDLVRQAASLPADFDAARASILLDSFGASVELLLLDNGVLIETPEAGTAFDPRRHRALSKTPTAHATLANTIASVTHPGYIDFASDTILAHAHVAVFSPVPPELPDGGTAADHRPTADQEIAE